MPYVFNEIALYYIVKYIKGVGLCRHPLEDARTPCCLHLFALPTHLEIYKRHARWKANHSCNEASVAWTAPHKGVFIRGNLLLNIYVFIIICFCYTNMPWTTY